MPDDVKISEMSEAASLDNSAQFPYVQLINGNLTTLKAPLSQIGPKINEGMTFSNLQTTSKNIVGAINEAAQGGGVEYATELPISSTDPTDTKSYIDTKTTLVKSASGSLIHITDGGDNIPMKSLESEIVAVESGNGQPKSPSNPYTISGFDSGIITRCGKNLFNPSKIRNGYFLTDGFHDYADWKGICIPVKSGEKYIISGMVNQAGGVRYAFIKDRNNLYSEFQLSWGSSTINGTFTVPEGFNGFWMPLASSNLSANIQVEKGSTATTYEAYNGNDYTFAFGQTVYGGYFDNKGNLVVTHGYITFNGSEFWNYSTSDGKRRVWLAIDDGKPSSLNIASNILSANSEIAGYPDVWKCCFNSNANPSLLIGVNDSINSASDWRTLLSNTNLQICYELATPITLSITSQNIPTLSGENNIFSNCGDLDIEYFTSSADDLAALIREQPAPLHHYSLGEVEIGTWIDGSTLYEKTIQITSLSVGTATLQHGISNFDTLVSASGRFTRADGKQSPISNVSTDTKSMVYASNFTDSSFVLFIGDNYQNATALTSMYLTIQYTKTT